MAVEAHNPDTWAPPPLPLQHQTLPLFSFPFSLPKPTPLYSSSLPLPQFLHSAENSCSAFIFEDRFLMQIELFDGGGGSLAAVSEAEDSVMMSSEESSSYPDDSELELGLGLSIGGGKAKAKPPPPPAAGGGGWDHYARILTAKDFSCSKTLSSSSSSSSNVTKVNTSGSSGTKRTAESPCSPPGRSAISQVVGWPPVRTYRMNSISNHAKSPVTEELFSTADNCKSKNAATPNHGGCINNNVLKEKGFGKTSLFVKVNMDGAPIGRKVDLNAHSCYKMLARTLDEMFTPSAAAGARGPNMEEQASVAGKRQPLRFLDGSSDFVLTYEDKDGDWMLVGDVPWEIFLSSVRRLRIMRTTDAKGLAPGSQERNQRKAVSPL